jgi:hypothetical protein
MNRKETEMLRIALASIMTVGLTASAFAEPAVRQNGQVSNVDRNGKAFTAMLSDYKSTTYKTTPNTRYMVGATPTSFEAVKAGHRVLIDAHMEGSTAIADQVVVQ